VAKPYLILDEYMRFLDRTVRQPSRLILILEVDILEALASVFWDQKAFKEGEAYLTGAGCLSSKAVGQKRTRNWISDRMFGSCL
jgi:radical S-adenosyl methionine domain-containing protein 2